MLRSKVSVFVSLFGFVAPLALSEANAGWPLFRRGQDCYPSTVCCTPSYQVCQPDVQVYQSAPASSACYSFMSCDETQSYTDLSPTCSTVMRSATVAESYSSSSSASIQQAIDRLDSVIGKLLQIQPNPEPSLKQLQDEIKKLQDEINKKTPISNKLESENLPSITSEAMERERAWTESTGQRKFLGRLLKIDPSSVQILRNDGKSFDVAFSRLSREDIAYIQSREDSRSSTLAMK